MDPVSALSLATTILKFIDYAVRVASQLEQLRTDYATAVPKPLAVICTQLPLLLNSLRRIGAEENVARLDYDTRCILRGVVAGCVIQTEALQAILDQIVRMPGDSTRARLHKVLVGMKKEEKISQIERNLHTYISVLILHHVVDQGDVPVKASDETSYFMVRERRLNDFFPRENLFQQLDTAFHNVARAQAKQPVHVLLVGKQMAGKTQLALEYCHQVHNLDQFKSVFWIDASSKENVLLGLESIAAIVQRSTSGTRSAMIQFVTKFLGELWHPWLLVLDNYDHYSDFDVTELLPTNGSGGILITTRDESAAVQGTVVTVKKFVTAQEQQHLDSTLTSAIQSEDTEKIKNAVEAGANVDAMIWGEWPCVHRVALLGLQDAVHILLAAGANQDLVPTMGRPLYWAASGGHTAIATMLINREDEQGYEPKVKDNTDAFKAAVQKGSSDIVELLLTHRKVDLNSKDNCGRSTLAAAARNGHLEIVKLLMQHGQWTKGDSEVNKAMHEAACQQHYEVAIYFLEDAGANVNHLETESSSGSSTILYEAVKNRPESGKPDPRAFVTYLLEQHGADPSITCPRDKSTPLHEAVLRGHSIELLLQYGADLTAENLLQFSPLTTAIQYKCEQSLTILLAKADTITDAEKKRHWLGTALRYACGNSDREFVLPLLEAGAPIDEVDWRGRTPLLCALDTDRPQVARLLIKRGARVDVRDKDGRVALPLAAERGHDVVVKELLRKHPGEVNVKSGDGETPVGLAAVKGHLKVIEMLLAHGADPELENKFGDTALDLAEEKKQVKVVELLEKLGVH